MSIRNPRDGDLRVLTINLHVGLVAILGGLRWLLIRTRPNIVLVQEAERPRHRRATRATLPAPLWIKVGPGPGQPGGTYVYLLRRRFKVLERHHQPISRRLGRMWPARALDAATVLDRRTGRVVDVSSLHTWHTVGHDLAGDSQVVRGHVDQLIRYADHHTAQHRRDPDAVQITGGDLNRDLTAAPTMPRAPRRSATRLRYDRHALTILGAAGLTPTRHLTRKGNTTGPRVDEVLVRPAPFLEVTRRKVIRVPLRQADHPGVFVRIRVDALLG